MEKAFSYLHNYTDSIGLYERGGEVLERGLRFHERGGGVLERGTRLYERGGEVLERGSWVLERGLRFYERGRVLEGADIVCNTKAVTSNG